MRMLTIKRRIKKDLDEKRRKSKKDAEAQRLIKEIQSRKLD